MTGSPGYRYLPVDDVSIPVGGIGRNEDQGMAYELLDVSLRGMSGFGVDEFRDAKAQIARNVAAAAPPRVGVTSITRTPQLAVVPKSIAPIRTPTGPVQMAPVVVPNTIPAQAPVTPAEAPPTTYTNIAPTSDIDPCTAQYGENAYTDARTGQCVGGAASHPPVNTNTTLLVGGGLVLAVGLAIYLSQRKV